MGVGLNRRGEGLWLIYSKLLAQGMHGVTEGNSLNFLFGVSSIMLALSSCVGRGSDSNSGKVIGSLL